MISSVGIFKEPCKGHFENFFLQILMQNLQYTVKTYIVYVFVNATILLD